MSGRAALLVVGLVSGVVSGLGAALIEAVLVTMRFITVGQHGPSIGSGLLIVMAAGAVAGGITAIALGRFFK
jgi:hypothetical protein